MHIKYIASVIYQLLNSSDVTNETCYWSCSSPSNGDYGIALDLESEENINDNDFVIFVFVVGILTGVCACIFIGVIAFGIRKCRARRVQYELVASLENNLEMEEQKDSVDENANINNDQE